MLSSAAPADEGISGLRGKVVSIATVQFSGKKRNGERPLKPIIFPVLLMSVHGD